MLSNFQVTTSVWAPARATVAFAPSVNTRFVELHELLAAQVAISLKALLLNVPDAPAPLFDHVAAFHVTSPTPQVVPPPVGAVKLAAFPCNEILSECPSTSTTLLVVTD